MSAKSASKKLNNKNNNKKNKNNKKIEDKSRIHEYRTREYKPTIPDCFRDLSNIKFQCSGKTQSKGHQDRIKRLFSQTYGNPVVNIVHQSDTSKSERTEYLASRTLKVGVMFAGGPAPGGHNVITGLFDALKELNPANELIGFLGGPSSVVHNKSKLLTSDLIDAYRNTGGFDLIGSGRYKTRPKAHFPTIFENLVFDQKLDGLVVIGGEGTNTLCALMAEYFGERFQSLLESDPDAFENLNIRRCTIIGVPKTIDGDLQNDLVEISFGFDTAVKTYSNLISNICRKCVDPGSEEAQQWHFIKLMGRDASHVTLECALQTHPNIALICEEIQSEKKLLADITEEIVYTICERSNRHKKDYGIILIPEGVIGFIPSMRQLVNDLDYMIQHEESLIHSHSLDAKIEQVQKLFKAKGKATELMNFRVLPYDIQKTLMLERDASGHIQMSQIPIEKLFMQMISKQLELRRKRGRYKGTFRPVGHFFGYEGRCAWPSNFDCNYCYNLGRVSAVLINQGYNGYMARVYDLEKEASKWKVGGIPLTSLLNMRGNFEMVLDKKDDDMVNAQIAKALVDVNSGKFQYFSTRSWRENWAVNDCYRYVAPIQFCGPMVVTDAPPMNVLFKKTNDIDWNPVVEKKEIVNDINDRERKEAETGNDSIESAGSSLNKDKVEIESLSNQVILT